MTKYSLNNDKSSVSSDTVKPVNLVKKRKLAVDTIRKLDEHNAVEQSIKFDKVRQNPPKKGYMRVDLVRTKDGRLFSRSSGRDGNGETLWIQEDPIATIDLKSALEADVAKVPSNTMDMLLDRHWMRAMEQRRIMQTEKRTSEFNWWWVVFFALMTPGILTISLWIASTFGWI